MTIEGELNRALVHAQFKEDQNQIALVTELKDLYDQKIAQGLLDILPNGTVGSEMRSALNIKEAGGHDLPNDVSVRDMVYSKHHLHFNTVGSNFVKQLSMEDRKSVNGVLSPLCNMYNGLNEAGKYTEYPFTLGDLRGYSFEQLMRSRRMSEDRTVFIKTAFGPLPLNTV